MKPLIIGVLGVDSVNYNILSKYIIDNFKDQIHVYNEVEQLSEVKKVFNKIIIPCDTIVYSKLCEIGIFVARDIRIQWVLSNMDIDEFTCHMKDHLKYYEILDKNDILEIDFDSLVHRPKIWIEKIRKHLKMFNNIDFINSIILHNQWFTTNDFDILQQNLFKLKQEHLDYLSQMFKEYNEYFGYPSELKIKDLFYRSIKQYGGNIEH